MSDTTGAQDVSEFDRFGAVHEGRSSSATSCMTAKYFVDTNVILYTIGKVA